MRSDSSMTATCSGPGVSGRGCPDAHLCLRLAGPLPKCRLWTQPSPSRGYWDSNLPRQKGEPRSCSGCVGRDARALEGGGSPHPNPSLDQVSGESGGQNQHPGLYETREGMTHDLGRKQSDLRTARSRAVRLGLFTVYLEMV